VLSHRLTPLALLVACFLIVAAIGQNLRYKGNFAHFTIAAGDAVTLTFLRQHMRSREACEATAESFAAMMVANCPVCRITRQECLRELSTEQSTLFSDASVPYPTARLRNGVMTYQGADPQLALTTCRLSEQQSPNGLVICSPPNVTRPLPAKLRESFDSLDSTFLGIAWLAGALIVGLALYLAFQWHNRRTAASSTKHSYDPRPAKITRAAGDTLVMLGTFLAIAWPNSAAVGGLTPIERNTLLIHAGLIGITILWFWVPLEHYSRRRPFWDELREIIRVIATMFIVAGATIFIAGAESAPSVQLSLWLLNLLLIPLGRTAFRGVLDCLGLWQMPTVIIGAGTNARDAAAALASDKSMGYHVVAFIDVEDTSVSSTELKESTPPIFSCSTSGTTSIQQHLEQLLAEQGQCQIVVALESLSEKRNQLLVQRLILTRAMINVIPKIRELPFLGADFSPFLSYESALLTLKNNLTRRSALWLKRGIDITMTLPALIVFAPVTIFFALLIFLYDPRNPFYSQSREGHLGKTFKVWKLRTMYHNANDLLTKYLESNPAAKAEWNKYFKLSHDPRILPIIGNFLRKSSIDELPQLWNVLIGQMSLVGPRPFPEYHLKSFSTEFQELRRTVKPGISGMWQVHSRSDGGLAVQEYFDTYYIRNWSIWLDIYIIFRTVRAVLEGRGAR
jgi:UDP-galactose-lipid carrier transferase